MKAKRKIKGLLERKLEDPAYREGFEKGFEAFKLEVQILKALEDKGWTFADLAAAIHTQKGNISRDLSAGGINSASISRLTRIGAALGLRFLPVFVPEKRHRAIASRIRRIVQ